ncbi:MAG: hypothetical protein WC365_01285 [Candidatus Babeliales bacterium]|jgi:hypothetical protein
MTETCIPHNGWCFIATHKSGGKYLYVSKKPLSMSDVAKWQNMDTIVSISKPDVNSVVIIE